MAKLSRRDFLRLLGVAAAGSVAAACESNLPTPTPTLEPTQVPTSTPTEAVPPTPTMEQPTPTPTSTPSIRLNGTKVDVWSQEAKVAGKTSGPTLCDQIQLEVNGQSVPATVDGQQFSAEIPVQEGENQVTAVCSGPAGELRSETATYTGKLQKRPVAWIKPSLEGEILVLDGHASQPSPDSTSIQEYVWSARKENPAFARVDGKEFSAELTGETLRLTFPKKDGEYYFSLRVKDAAGSIDSSATYVVIENGKLRIPDYDRENPSFVESTVVYGVVPFLFGPHGFRAIGNHLDDLQDLGINALWLAPVNVSPIGDYGYAIKDYFNLNPSYGSKDDFRQLIQDAHAHGIRILMDFVPNHSSNMHPYYRDLVTNQKDSPYWDFYDHDASGEVTHYFNWTYLPNHNYNNKDVWRYITEAFAYWVREFDVDGFRVDVAWGVKERCPEYWPEWRRELKRIKPDLLLLAEASARDPYYFDNGYDAAYDWTDALGHWAWENVWNTYKNNTLIPYLEMALLNGHTGYHPDALIFRFLNNNDTGKRFITNWGVEMARVATGMLLTLPGLPCIYTGDEYGEEFHPYEDSMPLKFVEKVPGLRDYHKKLISLRKEVPSLNSRNWTVVEVMPAPKVYAYVRHLPDGSRPVLVLLNFFPEDLDVTVELPEQFRSLAKGGILRDLVTDENIPSQGGESLKLKMTGMRAMVLSSL